MCVWWQGFTPIWYLYAMASVQLLQVINTSCNFPIYWFVGTFRETFIQIFCNCASDKPQPARLQYNGGQDYKLYI